MPIDASRARADIARNARDSGATGRFLIENLQKSLDLDAHLHERRRSSRLRVSVEGAARLVQHGVGPDRGPTHFDKIVGRSRSGKAVDQPSQRFEFFRAVRISAQRMPGQFETRALARQR